MNFLRSYLPSLGAVLLFCAALLSTPCAAAPLDSKVCQQDPRLEKTVTLVSPRIYVGELMERLSKQSGVAVSADEEDGAADVEVAVSLRRVPLADALDALWSLVSYQDAEWEWSRAGKEGGYKYRLVQSEAARLFPKTVQEQVQKQYEAQAKKMLDALNMASDKLQEAAKTDDQLRSLIDGKDERVRPSLKIFAGLPSEVQQAILHDHKGVSIPVSDLSPEGQKYVRDQWIKLRDSGAMTKDEQGNLIPVREPQRIGIGGEPEADGIAPWLVVDTGFGGGDLVGGRMEEEWRDKIALLWMRPGDAADSPACGRTAAAPPTHPVAPSVSFPFANNLLYLSQAVPLSLIARLQDERGYSNSTIDSPPHGQTVRAYLAGLTEARVPHKFRNGILLLSQSGWLMKTDSNAPWAIVRRLRDSEDKGDGYLTLDDFARAAGRTTTPRMQALSAHFPGMAGAASWHDLLALYDGSPSLRPRLLSPQGDDYAGSLHAAAAGMNQDIEKARKLVADGSAARVRLLVLQHDDWKPVVREVRVQLLSGAGRVVLEQGFTYSRHQWRSSVEATDDGSQVKH